jgi:Domain of unknown function (DUF4265)
MKDQTANVRLRVDRVDGKSVYEEVPALQVGENRYRIVASPGLAPGVASGDEIELDPSDPERYNILKRGMNVCVQAFFTECTLRDRDRVTALFQEIGGWLDGGKDGEVGQLLIFTIPAKVGFETIEGLLTRVSEEFKLEKWEYGNVYDPADGVTPLNWWR